MTAITERLPMDEISRKADSIRFGQVVLTLFTAPMVALGWVVGKVLLVAWRVLKWNYAAVNVGWEHAQLRATTPKLTLHEQASLMAEVENLRAEIERLHGRG